MNRLEEGILLLCCPLGIDSPRPLTMAQFRTLGERVRAHNWQEDSLTELTEAHLLQLYPDPQWAERIVRLLDRRQALETYVSQARNAGILPLTRISPAYPRPIARAQGLSAPPVLFAKGDLRLLEQPAVSVVGSRHLFPENREFARQAGLLAAQEGFVLVSGGAPGADTEAMEACLDAGGSCVIFVADPLPHHPDLERVLWISEDGWDLPFSAPRALHRNGLIHMQGEKTLAAQCTYGSGGTWQGCRENLRRGWSPLFVFADGSPAMAALRELGATAVESLTSLASLHPNQISLF